jgi:hypothetical protein
MIYVPSIPFRKMLIRLNLRGTIVQQICEYFEDLFG